MAELVGTVSPCEPDLTSSRARTIPLHREGLKVLKNDNRAIFTGAGQAQRASIISMAFSRALADAGRRSVVKTSLACARRHEFKHPSLSVALFTKCDISRPARRFPSGSLVVAAGPVVKVARAVNQPFTVCEAALPHFSSIRDANDARLPRKAKRLMFGHCTYLQHPKSVARASAATALFRSALLVATGMLVMLSARSAAAQTTYTYTGNPFTLFSCGPAVPGPGDVDCTTPAPTNPYTSYLPTDFVSATLTFDSPLGPNLALQDVRTLPGFQLTMADGRHTGTFTPNGYTQVATDASGQIVQWNLTIATGVLAGGIITRNYSGAGLTVYDQGVLACCSPTVTGDFGLNIGTPGTWSSGSPSPASLVTNLINVVSNPLLGLTGGQVSSLTDKLNNVLVSIQGGLNKQAINQLTAFINSVVSSEKTGKMSAQTANTLVAAANAIIALL